MNTSTKRIPWLALAGVLTLVAGVACGKPESKTDDELGIPEGAAVMNQGGVEFEPEEMTVGTGETVWFVNRSSPIHNVAINGTDESGQMKRNDVFQFTFGEPGAYDIVCDYHPQMTAVITVE